MNDQCSLANRTCKPCEGGTAPLSREAATCYLSDLQGWELGEGVIRKKYGFKNFYETMAFVNAVAWIANREDHHPDLEVSYRNCTVRYSTHAVGGLSENDFICAAKIDQLLG